MNRQTRSILAILLCSLSLSGFAAGPDDKRVVATMNAIDAGYFKTNPPAQATVEVARLPRDVQIEISAIAVK